MGEGVEKNRGQMYVIYIYSESKYSYGIASTMLLSKYKMLHFVFIHLFILQTFNYTEEMSTLFPRFP